MNESLRETECVCVCVCVCVRERERERFPRCECFSAKPHSLLSADLRGRGVELLSLSSVITCVSQSTHITHTSLGQEEVYSNSL